MESVLAKIANECNAKQTPIKEAAILANDLVLGQQVNPIVDMHELREKCLTALELALDARGSRLPQYGFEGLQLLLRDNQLHSLEGCIEKPEQTLPMQVLHTLSCLPDWHHEPDTQCHCLTITLQILCCPSWIVVSQTVTTALDLCLSTFISARQNSVRMAARATVSQILDSYCTGLYKEQAEDAAEDDYRTVFNEVTTLTEFCTHKLSLMNSSTDQSPGLLLVVDALYAVLSVQSLAIRKHEEFMNLLWQDLCPSLIALLGTPYKETSPRTPTSPSHSVGRGKSAVGGEQPIFASPDVAKCVYLCCGELLRIMGPLPGMRSVLEALFHRIFLFPPVEKRVEALRTFKKILSVPSAALDLLILNAPDDAGDKSSESSDLNLWKIILDSIVECSLCSHLDVVVSAVQCCDTLLTSLTSVIDPQAQLLPPDSVDDINRQFHTLRQADSQAFTYRLENAHSNVILPELSVDDSVELEDAVMMSPVATPEHRGEEQPQTEQEPVDECMKSVAERIGSALRRSQFEQTQSERHQRLLHVQAALDHQFSQEYNVAKDATENMENNRALHFVDALCVKVNEWTELRSILEVDEHMLKFAASYCKEYMERQESQFQNDTNQLIFVLNSDAVYLLSFAAMRLCYRLKQSGFYSSVTPQQQQILISEDAFTQELLASRCIVFASEAFVRNVYRQLLKQNLFAKIGLTDEDKTRGPLVGIVEDYDGQSCQLLSDVMRLENASKRTTLTLHCVASRKLCRRVLTASWEGLVAVLSSLVEAIRQHTGRSLSSFVTSLVSKSALGSKHRDHALLISDGLSAGLGGLQRLAHLCNHLKLQSRSGWIFRKLVEVSCPLDELRAGDWCRQSKLSKLTNQTASCWSLRVPDVLSIEIVLDSAIESGTHAPECWTHVIRCTEYVWELERYFFGRLNSSASKVTSGWSKKPKIASKEQMEEEEELVHHFAIPGSPLQSGPACAVVDILDQYGGIRPDSGDQLEPQLTARILCLLMAKVDGFYDNVCRCLNLRAVREFGEALVTASQSRLLYSVADEGLLERSTLLQRLSQTLTRLGRSARPMAHLMLVWASTCAHFVEAACSHDATVAEKSISSLHECVASLLSGQSGTLEAFRFNEALLSPFQNILCLDVADPETQDQIVSIIAEFVEMYPEQIGSGWRPLFGALKAVRTAATSPEQGDTQLMRMHNTVLDVFGTFLKTENWGVFCLAALDCINCLLHYLQASDLLLPDEEDENATYADRSLSLCRPALNYLRGVHSLLGTLFSMNRLPVFHLLHRLLLRERSTQKVDRNIPDSYADRLPSLASVLSENGFFGPVVNDLDTLWLEQYRDDGEAASVPWSSLPVTQLAIVEAWLTLIEGLTGAVVTCPRPVQPDVLQSLYEMCESIRTCPGPSFGAYCLSHLVLPMLQNWLRREARFSSGWRENSPSVRNFKQAVGLTTESVVGYVGNTHENECHLRLLKDTLSLLVECVAQPSEVISRLGCSCLRHVILSCANVFCQAHWSITCQALWRATCVTLHPIRTLMSHFAVGSHEYYGDFGCVQVALRKDSNPREAARVRALAQQVFLLDSQKFVENLEDHPDMLSQSQHSIILLLHPQSDKQELNPELKIIRLPFRDVVISLLSHQLLLQMIGTILLRDTKLVVGGVSSLLIRQLMDSSTSARSNSLPGWLHRLEWDHLNSLFLCLDASFQIGFEFDQRPGLKFLLQKVFNSTVAANLYKQVVTAWTLRGLTLYEFAKSTKLTPPQVTTICQSPTNNSAADAESRYLLMLSDSYMRICSQLCVVERSTSQGKEQSRLAELDEPFVFLLAAPEEMTTNKGGDTEKTTNGEENDALLNDQETVYSIVDNEQLNDLLAEYKRRKQQATMPSKPTVRENPFAKSETTATNVSGDDDPVLRQEQTDSVLKDGDARCLAWSEMVVSEVQLLLSEQDGAFRALLPVFYPSLVHLTAGSAQPRVRQSLADFMYRLNETFSFLTREL